MNVHSVSIVIPVYNEEDIIEKNIRKLVIFLEEKNIEDYEIIISENGSTDKTLEKAEKISSKHSKIKIVTTPFASFGKSIRIGVLETVKDVIVVYPIDLAFSLDFIYRPLKYMNKYEVVFGVRHHRESKMDRPMVRKIISKIHTPLINLILKSSFNDIDGLKCYKNEIGKEIIKKTKSNTPFIEVEIAAIIKNTGISYIEIPINHTETEIARHPRYIIKSIYKHVFELIKDYDRLRKMKI